MPRIGKLKFRSASHIS